MKRLYIGHTQFERSGGGAAAALGTKHVPYERRLIRQKWSNRPNNHVQSERWHTLHDLDEFAGREAKMSGIRGSEYGGSTPVSIQCETPGGLSAAPSSAL